MLDRETLCIISDGAHARIGGNVKKNVWVMPLHFGMHLPHLIMQLNTEISSNNSSLHIQDRGEYTGAIPRNKF